MITNACHAFFPMIVWLWSSYSLSSAIDDSSDKALPDLRLLHRLGSHILYPGSFVGHIWLVLAASKPDVFISATILLSHRQLKLWGAYIYVVRVPSNLDRSCYFLVRALI